MLNKKQGIGGDFCPALFFNFETYSPTAPLPRSPCLFVNLRPRQNRSMQILDTAICEQVKQTNHPQVIRKNMNNWTGKELAFWCERLSMRLEKLAQNFLQMAVLSLDVSNSEAVLAIIPEGKGFLELMALDLDVNHVFELAQMQQRLSR